VLRSPYLLAICGFVALGTTLATFIYFQQAQIIGRTVTNPGLRTALFATMDLIVNALTIGLQLFMTAQLVARFGLTRMLAVVPALNLVGFVALAAAPVAAVLISFQVLRRATQYGITGPARETLFTVLTREEKYKAKSFIDTVVYRGGDAASGWLFAWLSALGLGISGIAAASLPLIAVWIGIAVYLGRREEELRHGA